MLIKQKIKIHNIARAQKKGFTLLEILIASVIFAGVMLITAATVAQSSTYQTKLTAMRETSEDTRRLSDLLTREIRSANNAATLVLTPINPTGTTTYKFKNGVALVHCGVRYDDSLQCAPKFFGGTNPNYSASDPNNNRLIESPSSTVGDPFIGNYTNILVISTKEKYKVYISVVPGGPSEPQSLYYKEFVGRSSLNNNDFYHIVDTTNSIVSRKTGAENNYIGKYDTRVNFGGFCPEDSITANTYQQSYVQFYIGSRTKLYDQQSVNDRARADIRTTVTLRNYSN